MNGLWEKMGRKLLWPIYKYCTRICLEGIGWKRWGKSGCKIWGSSNSVTGGFGYCGMRRRVFGRVASDVLKAHIAFILRVKQHSFLDSFTFVNEDIMSLRNFGDCSPSVKSVTSLKTLSTCILILRIICLCAKVWTLHVLNTRLVLSSLLWHLI